MDERPKIRKSSHEAIRTLLRGGHARYLANNIVSCLEQLLKSASQKNTKPVLVILPLVQDILPYLLDSHAVKGGNSSTKSLKQSPAGRLIFALLRTQAFLSDSRFSELTFRSFQNSVVSKTVRQQSGNSGGNADEEATTKWSPALLSLFLSTLMDLRPGHQQLLQVGGSYLPLLADAMVCMHRSDTTMSLALLPRVVSTIQTFFDSTNEDVHRWASEAMARLCVHCIAENEVVETNTTIIKNGDEPGGKAPKSLLPLQQVAQAWADLFTPRYRHARRVIVPFAQGVFDHFNKRAFPILNPIVGIITSMLDEERQKGVRT